MKKKPSNHGEMKVGKSKRFNGVKKGEIRGKEGKSQVRLIKASKLILNVQEERKNPKSHIL